MMRLPAEQKWREKEREYLNKIELLEKRISQLEEEKKWLEGEVREIHSELVEEKNIIILYELFC